MFFLLEVNDEALICNIYPTSEGETFSKQVTRVDFDMPLVNNMQLVPQLQEEPNSNIEIDHGHEVSGGVNDYILICHI